MGTIDQLDRRFEAIVFDWDGTAVPDRSADASEARALVEGLVDAGAYVAVVSGTHVGNVDGQLQARPAGPGRLVLALNRGSEVFLVGPAGPELIHRRDATPEEDAALDAAAQLTVERLAECGVTAAIVSERLNRRKIDIIPVPEWQDPPKAEIDRLLAACIERLHTAGLGGLPDVVEIALQAAREVGLADPRVTSDAKHVEIGLTDKAHSAEWILQDLWTRGIGPGLVLFGGDEFGPLGGLPGSDSLMLVPRASRAVAVSVGVEPNGVPDGVLALDGGPARFLELLADQLRRRTDAHVPDIDRDPAWTLTIDGFDPEHEHANESLLTLADGHLGTSGTPMPAHSLTTPWVLAAGVYDGEGADAHLLDGPVWHRLPCEIGAGDDLRRTLDFHTGVLEERVTTRHGDFRSLRFSSLARPATVALRAACPPGFPRPHQPLLPPAADPTHEGGEVDGVQWMSVAASTGGIAAAARDRMETSAHGEALERLAAYVPDAERVPEGEEAVAALLRAEALGFERLLAEHRASWARRWEDADIELEGDVRLQQAVRFALFHLMASAGDVGEAAVGARGLSGAAYRGHVFWDADAFVLPFLAATHPPAARAMLEYRVRRLPMALDNARREGLRGARYPWESARTGRDVTPTFARDRAGNVIPIRTGRDEVHIVAQVAWAACTYLDWTGDEEFASGAGRELLLETARFWESVIRVEADGSGHIYGVIGPDEYHEPVDDSAFTNVMARWNLRRAAAQGGADPDERDRWLALADALVDGYDEDTGVYEEFAGYHSLEPLIIAEAVPRRPVAADLVLGRDRVRASQVVKQADVLMLHHLVPEETAPGSLEPNLRHYEPRTAHGSSLSPGIHAALFARTRDYERALAALEIAARIDLDDLTDTGAGGLHLATLGSLWQAFAFGFLGLRAHPEGLAADPHLPPQWPTLSMRLRFRGSQVRIRKAHQRLIVRADPGITLLLGGDAHAIGPAGLRFRRRGTTWEVDER